MKKNSLINVAHSIEGIESKIKRVLDSKESVAGKRTYMATSSYKSKVAQIVALYGKYDELLTDKEIVDEAKEMSNHKPKGKKINQHHEVLNRVNVIRTHCIPTKKKASNK